MGQTMGRPLFGGLSALFLPLPGTLGDGTTRRGAAWLASRPMVALGAISYGVYLWHTQWIELYVEWRNAGDVPDHTAVLLAFVVAATIASATFSWFVVERPFVRLAARHLARPRRPRPTPAPLVATN
jgi:peptidoglycan/LPS O-acetylase OafA/YrhL